MTRLLVIITSNYPYGRGESFLEAEVSHLGTSRAFDKILFLSLSSSSRADDLTRQLPLNTSSVKLGRKYRAFRCALSASSRLFSIESFREFRQARTLVHRPTVFVLLRQMVLFFAIDKRISLFLHAYTRQYAEVFVYSYWLSAGAYAAAQLRKRGLSTVSISRCHGGEVRESETYLPFRSFTDTWLDAIHFVSEDRRERYNAIMDSRPKPDAQRARQYVSRLGTTVSRDVDLDVSIDPNVLHVTSISNVVPIKRLHLLVEALAQVDDSICVHWTHLGHGALFDRISSQSATLLAPRPNISFDLRGHVDHSAVLDHLRDDPVDVVVNCSSDEGLPVTLMEAMARGIPAIAFDVGGISEIVIDGVTGVLLPRSSTSADISREMCRIADIKSTVAYRNLCKSAFELADGRFNSQRNYELFFKSVVSLRDSVSRQDVR